MCLVIIWIKKSDVGSAKTSDVTQVLPDILVVVLEVAIEKKTWWLVRVNHPGEEVVVGVVLIHKRQATKAFYYIL